MPIRMQRSINKDCDEFKQKVIVDVTKVKT